jgi:AcrR family transcriptional regulator
MAVSRRPHRNRDKIMQSPAPTRGDTRRLAILEAATEVFMELGYAGASVDRIVQRAGGSKGTVYRHFGCKADLFEEIITALVARMTAPIEHQRPTAVDTVAELAVTLARFGQTYLDVLVQPQSLALYRMVMAEGANFPDLARVFYERGPGQVAMQLADYLAALQSWAQIAAPEPEVAAREFLSLVRSDLHLKALLGVEVPTAVQRELAVKRAVALFLAQYQPVPGSDAGT